MKKRILLLIPCILLALGLLTACGDNGSQSSGSIENQLINAKWESSISNDTKLGGLIDIDSHLGDILTIKFEKNGTGYIDILKNSGFQITFNWEVNQATKQIKLTFDKAGFIPFNLNFQLDPSGLVLDGTNFKIKFNNQN
ncbi:hypothetical protein [Faecalibacterium gallinarum]|uniref:DUF5640 domain-containing protein n=1 Tax=Faecalibacterium gallinarum TaxID=2903556 RepID=A0AA37IZL8_9FIRM|nr:hypothetical protein [Faecalibacterium gallinarum]GJN65261.1 hypothetical protein JCM17207_18860 [Faecalibacterium gallinarum]